MRACRNLVVLQDRVLTRIDRLSVLSQQSARLTGEARDRATAYVVIEAANAWAGYCRYFYLSCAFGARDASNVRASKERDFPSEEAALTHVIVALNPDQVGKGPPWAPGVEPDWNQPSELVRALGTLDARNLPTIEKAVSAKTLALELMPTFRNFYAHRGEKTAKKAKRLGPRFLLPTTLHPTEILQSSTRRSGERLIDRWLAEVRGVVALTV